VEAGSIVWSHSAWIPKVSSQKDLAKAYISEAILSQYFQQWDFNHYGKLPTLKAYYGDGITRFEEEMPLLLEIANGAKPIPVYRELEKYLDVLAMYLPDAVFGRISVDKALQSIQEASKDLDFTNLRFR
jgi:ABC-type glycerol-3-phosphate transport system substrate-binding protein